MPWENLLAPPRPAAEVVVYEAGAPKRQTWAELARMSLQVAGSMRAAGVHPGERIAAIVTNTVEAAASVVGAWLAGASVASLPLPARGMSLAHYGEQLRRMVAAVRPALFAVDQQFLPLLPEALRRELPCRGFQSLVEGSALRDPTPPARRAAAFIQFSSGTTGTPKGAVLSVAAIDAQLAALRERLSLDPSDRGVTWLPLSHDMGLFGSLLVAWSTGMAGLLGTPERFLRAPRSWFDDCARFGATVTAGPPSALDTAARAERANPGRAPLKLRACLIGGERIAPATLETTVATFARRGLGAESLVPAYGLAEATLAVTVAAPGERPNIACVDRRELLEGKLRTVAANAPGHSRIVSCGRAVAGTAIAIDDGSVGRVTVSSASLMNGYLGADGGLPPEHAIEDFDTGDVGFMVDGELFVTGRADDVINVGARRIEALELEEALTREPGMRAGLCAVVDVAEQDSTPRLVAVAETTPSPKDLQALARQLASRARELAGLPLDECVFLPRGSLPKTPSGKIRRFDCRELARGGTAGYRVALRNRRAKLKSAASTRSGAQSSPPTRT